ncbi:MAG: xanthine dehydrogenase family protein molybdopterin-binding subunit [Candidatus Hodarchaeales archaeon]
MFNKVVGASIPRADAHEKVTGTALYIDDLRFPRTLIMKVLRAGVPHATIKTIDISKALDMPGIHKVFTGKSLNLDKDHLFGTCIFDQPPLAIDKVRHAGEVVAVVIAETEKQALAAIKNIFPVFEELPFTLDPIESASKEAPIIHEQNGNYRHVPTFVPEPQTNVFYKYRLKKGNYEFPFQDAEITVEDNFEYPLMNHAAIEPHGAIARWDHTGELHLWSSSQAPFVLREVLADYFKIKLMTKIHIHIPYLGGGFGGKSDYTIEPLVALAAKLVPGYHVKFVLTRKEVFIGSVLGRGMKGQMKLGAKKDGTLVGIEATQYYSDGAYGDTGCNVVLAAGHNCVGPYFFPNCNLKSYGVYTNSTPVGAFRGYGHPEGQFMIERLLDKLASTLEIDPNELRMKNFLSPGDTNSLGQVISDHNGDIRKCFTQTITKLDEFPLPPEDEKFFYGRAVVGLIKSPVQTANASSNVFLKFNEDLTVNISIGGVELGQGSLTVLAQIAAEALHIPVDMVRINYEINTQLTPYEWQTVASMTTMRVGNAIIDACNKAIRKFKENAAEVWGCTVTNTVYDGTKVSYQDKSLDLKHLVLGYQYSDGHTVGNPILSTGSSVVRNVTFPDLETGQYQPYEWTFGSQGVDLKINKNTGEISILHFVTALDAGKIINPALARGQITGGVMQGIGQALKEKIEYDDSGNMRTVNLRKYAIPKLSDMPKKYSCIFIETPQPNGPYGARPIAEHPALGPPSVILNAIQRVTGISFTSIPVTKERMLAAIQKGGI